MKKRKKYHLKKKYKIYFSAFMIIAFTIVLAIMISKIVLWKIDNNKSDDINEKITNIVEVKEILPDEIPEDNIIELPDIYFKYKDVKMIDVDFETLKNENKDTIGWIYVEGTNINYPIVQAKDNDYYLTRDYSKNYNTGGWIFLDYKNDINNLDLNNVIYGHRRKNNSMFGTLKNVLKKDWLNNKDNHIIKIATDKYSYLFEVFSVYTTVNESYYIKTTFNNDNEKQTFIDTITERSIYNFDIKVNIDDKIITLSTCYNTADRLAVHAKLIKTIKKSS